jgi:hypothetical protein
MRSFWSSLPLLAAVCGAVLGWTQLSRAEPASATGKGVVGGALLGAEATLITEAVARVKPRWAYALGGVLGAALGGTLGYFVEKSGDARWSMVLLTGGTALLIPASAITLDATLYRDPGDPSVDTAPAGAASRALLAVHHRPSSGGVAAHLAVPSVSLAPVFSGAELANFGLRQRAGVRLPLLSLMF